MSVIDYKTFVSKIRIKLIEEIHNLQLVKKWFDRIIVIEFLQSRNIISPIVEYNKTEVIEACNFIDKYFPNIFNDDINQLFSVFPEKFYNNEIISLLKENINSTTPIEEINNYQEDFKDHERYAEFKVVNRNLETKVDDKNITALTQIFTPKWICKYFINETIGAHQEDFQNIKILDPCLGTGQILIYAFDKLVDLYKENTNYTITEIVQKILNNQLYGFDIDEDAISLAKFIFTFKAYELSNEFILNNKELDFNFYSINEYQFKNIKLAKIFEKASLVGSLIEVPDLDYNKLIDNTLDEKEKEYLTICKNLSIKYDIVLTNPPYMGRKVMPDELLRYLSKRFKYGKSELYAAFMERCLKFLKEDGYLGMITLHTWMFIKSFTDLRKHILTNYQINSLLHLGKNTFENLNAYNALASAFIIQNKKPINHVTFVDLTKYDNIILKEAAYNNKSDIYKVNQKRLLTLDNYQLLYWLSDKELNHLLNTPKLFNHSFIRQGLATGDNRKYIRYWWEVDKEEIGFNFQSYQEFLKSQYKYAPYNKGGDQTKWYSTSKVVIKFDSKHFNELKEKGNHLPSREYYFKEGITWSLFGFNSFNVRYKEQGYVFDVSGSSLFTTPEKIKYILGYLSSDVAFNFLSSIAPTVNFQVGNIISLPFIFDENKLSKVDNLVDELIEKSKYLDCQNELSWNFKSYELFDNYDNNCSFIDNIKKYNKKINDIHIEIAEKEIELNKIFNDIYEFEPINKSNKHHHRITLKQTVEDVISFLIGVIFGRYTYKNYKVVIDNKKFVNLSEVIYELEKILSEDIIKQIESVLKVPIDIYMAKYFIKAHINKYLGLPIYWYKKENNEIKIGYYHTLKVIMIDKSIGIKLNYLNNDLIYRLK